MVVVVGILIFLVVHAATKVTATATIAAGGDPSPLPPVTSVAATGNAQSPSPATWGGGPGAASSWAIKVNTNSKGVGVASTGLTTQAPFTPGQPMPFVKSQQSNGFDAVPASTKQLSVNRMPARTLSGRLYGGTKL